MNSHPVCCFLLFSIAIVVMVTSIRGQKVESHDYCAPVITYVEADPEYKFEPLVVKLHRCAGKNKGTSRNKACVARTTENVTYRVDDFTGVPRTSVIANHTSCMEQCRYDSSICNVNQTWDTFDCTCQCKFKTPQKCEEGFRWDSYQCACICPTRRRPAQCDNFKTFSEEACGCVCEAKRFRRCRKKGMYTDPETCYCTTNPPYTGAQEAQDCSHTGVISKVGLILLCISEAILFVIGYVMYRKYCRDRKMCLIKKKTDSDFDNDDTTLPRHTLIHNTPNADKRSLHTPTIELPTSAGNQNGGTRHHHTKSSSSNNNKLYVGVGKVAGSSLSYDALLKEQSTEYLHDTDHERSLEEERDEWRRSYKDMVNV